MYQRFQVEIRTSQKNGGLIVVGEPTDNLGGVVSELSSVICFVRIQDIDEMMRDRLTHLYRWFGRADIHPAIYLHGIDRDDLTVNLTRQLNPDFGLTTGGWPDNSDDGEFICQR